MMGIAILRERASDRAGEDGNSNGYRDHYAKRFACIAFFSTCTSVSVMLESKDGE